ncbi:5-(carboxyamino)imidazole ribonucleotide mutase, partial [Gluconobacter oxydans]|uniref:5-(carboxyamino)imidazole ribonucleotide mutase n=1 Tax=Gluconobacter oxydans TaxID=442 RepID=UPI0039EB2713
MSQILSADETLQDDMPIRVGVIMGSQSDWDTMRHACEILDDLGIAHEKRIVSAHRTPDRLVDYAKTARQRGLHVIIAGAGGAAHLPGMCSAWTSIPVLGVPVQSRARNGEDRHRSNRQLTRGGPGGARGLRP